MMYPVATDARMPMQPDIFFVSSREHNAEPNWARLKAVAPHARRISGQLSIRAAYAACAEASCTSHFFMVDGDNWVLDGFAFAVDFEPGPDEVAVWRARNPVNGLVYGNGAIKLLPTGRVRAAALDDAIDIGSSLGATCRRVEIAASEHRFNTGAFEAWRTAFRECVKLAAGLIRGADAAVSAARLDVWCADLPAGLQPPAYAELCVAGGREGRAFGRRHAGQMEALALINDYAWLRRRWERRPTAHGSDPWPGMEMLRANTLCRDDSPRRG